MSVYRVRRWGTGVGLAAGGAMAAAVMAGMGFAHADDTPDVLNAADGAVAPLSVDGSVPSDYLSEWLAAANATATPTTPDELLNSATTNLTDGVNILSADVPGHVDIANELAPQAGALQQIADLQSAEDAISSHDGSLSSLVNQLFFIPLDQDWDHTTEALLQGDQAVDAAIASGSSLETAELGLVGPDFQLASNLLDSFPLIIAGEFFGADITP